MPADLDDVAVVENHAQRADMVAGGAVLKGVRAGSVRRQHAADGADGGAGGVGPEAAAVGGEARVQRGQRDAGLDADPVGPDLDDLAERLRQVDDDAAAQGFAGDAGAGPARNERDLVLEAVADELGEIGLVARHDDAGRLDLEDAGVGAVDVASDVVEANVPLEEPSQVVADSTSSLWIHSWLYRREDERFVWTTIHVLVCHGHGFAWP